MAEYARHRGCDYQLVQAAVRAGRITRGEDGLIDQDQADLDWAKNTDQSQVRTNLKHRRRDPQVDVEVGRKLQAQWVEKQRGQEDDILGDTQQGKTAPINFASARAAREIFAARLLKVELDQKLKTLVDKRTVQLEAQNRGQVLRDALLNIPDRLSAQLAAEQSPAGVHEILASEIRMVLEEYSEGKLG